MEGVVSENGLKRLNEFRKEWRVQADHVMDNVPMRLNEEGGISAVHQHVVFVVTLC